MESNPKLIFEISELVTKMLDQSISSEEFDRLQYLIRNEPCALDLYIEIISLYPCLDVIKELDIDYNELSYEQLLRELARDAKTAPPVNLASDKEQDNIDNVIRPARDKQKLNKLSKYVLASSVAASLLFTLFLYFAPDRSGVEVATLVDQMNTKWSTSESHIKNGRRLWTSDGPFDLKKGIVEIQFDDGVDVLIEGPALFSVERLGLYIEYGRLYSRVSDAGLGFTVKTSTSQFVDHGTEFGILANINGSSELHVIKGKVQLFAETKKVSKTGQMVTENKAVRYNSNNGKINSIPIEKEVFVRKVDSHSRTIWRGQNRIDLADIVGGGDGFGTGRQGGYIETVSGRCGFGSRIETTGAQNEMRWSSDGYQPVPDNPFVDGVFIPDATEIASQVDSAGTRVDVMIDTTGTGWGGVINVRQILDHPIMLGNARYGIGGSNALFMHANAGITFDLDSIRQICPGASIQSFRAEYGVAKPLSGSKQGAYADFWVVVDGEVRFIQKGVVPTNAEKINISISNKDRFLSLITTDGGPGTPAIEDGQRTAFKDWCVFGNPILVLE